MSRTTTTVVCTLLSLNLVCLAAVPLLQIGHHSHQRRRFLQEDSTVEGILGDANCTETIPEQLERVERNVPDGRRIGNWTNQTLLHGTWFFYPQVGWQMFACFNESLTFLHDRTSKASTTWWSITFALPRTYRPM